MGVSCSPYLANLMLFMYELEFFDGFISKHDPIRNKQARQLLWKLSCCTRYIDDLWNPLVPKAKFQSITKQMYPTWLQLGDPESEGTMVNYLDMSIWQQDGTWQSKLYDKRVELQAKGLKLNKFSHPGNQNHHKMQIWSNQQPTSQIQDSLYPNLPLPRCCHNTLH